MARKSPASTSELNDLHRKLAKCLSAALDGEVDADGVATPPTASVLSVARAFLSDSKIVPAISGDDQIDRLKATYSSLPFTSTNEDGVPTNHSAKH
jgi:hypothetical protein